MDLEIRLTNVWKLYKWKDLERQEKKEEVLVQFGAAYWSLE